MSSDIIHFIAHDVRVAGVTIAATMTTGVSELVGWLNDGGFATMAAGSLSVVLIYTHIKRMRIELAQERDNKLLREHEIAKAIAEREKAEIEAREVREYKEKLEKRKAAGLPTQRKIDEVL